MHLTKKLGFRSRLELLIFPTILFIFLVNMHFFQWYRDHYSRSTAYIKNIAINDRYERIQSQHPYYEIYKLAKEYKGKENKVHFVFYFQDDRTVDYVTTYFLNPANTAEEKLKRYYMSELGLFINYFFYPRLIKPISPDDLTRVNLGPGDVIISDMDLYNLPKLGKKTLSLLSSLDKSTQVITHKEALIPNRRPEDIYFIYTIEKINNL